LGTLDPNTLYFIYANDDAATGILYMGDKLIGGNNSSINPSSMSLNDLTDVIVENAETNSFLIKDDEGNWVARTVEDVIALI
jgi:hypothetical protein